MILGVLPVIWLKKLKVQVKFKEPLSEHTTFGIGGPADALVRPANFKLLQEVIISCLKEKIPYLVIGKGSNFLFSDRGFKGVVISLDANAFNKIRIKGKEVFCGAGVFLSRLISQTQKKGLSGLEFLAAIPATCAGALIMNAGNRKKAIGKVVQSVTVMDKKGKQHLLSKKKLKFSYRRSSLDKYVVLEVVLKLTKSTPAKVKENIAAHLNQKIKTQDLSTRNAGCVFMNPNNGLSAGKMIESCGLKGRRFGGAEISRKHANYIINCNKAKAKDVIYLLKLAQREVKNKFRVNLKPEIKIIQ